MCVTCAVRHSFPSDFLRSEPGTPLLYIFAILYGTGMGIKTIVQATAAPEFLSREGYGALQGTFAGINYAVQSATPFATAFLWQATGRYDEVVWLLFAVTALSAVAFALAVLLKPQPVSATKLLNFTQSNDG